MKMTKLLSLLFALTICGQALATEKARAYFSPHQGKAAFQRIFSEIQTARESVYVTVYSWKMAALRKSLESALSNKYCVEFKNRWKKNEKCLRYQPKPKADVYLVMDNRHEEKRLKDIVALEKQGAKIRVSKKGMHEKFVMVDEHFVMNTSANFSHGAQNNYSESFVMFKLQGNSNSSLLLLKEALKKEFALIWNAGREQKTESNPKAYGKHHPPLPLKAWSEQEMSDERIEFLSSSMNFRIKHLKSTQADGLYTKLSSTDRWMVMGRISELIDQAQHSVVLNVNYLLWGPLLEALKRAHDRGVTVRILNDNKNANNRKDYSSDFAYYVKKQTPNAPIPARFKFYSFFPTSGKSYLNHHKYLLIDYYQGNKQPVRDHTVLIFGSHNLSYRAEKNQFDNMIVFKTPFFTGLYKDFAQEFEQMWMQGRTSKDQPRQDVWKYYLTPSRGKYRIHSSRMDMSVALTGSEINALKRNLKKLAPNMLDRKVPRGLLENCFYYSPSAQKYYDRSFKECNGERK